MNTYGYVGDNPISGIDPLGLCDHKKCTAARALVALLGQQLSAEGKVTTWAGIGLVGASGVAAIFAPEGAPAEYAGAAEGAGLIEVGGYASTAGTALTAYANGGWKNAGAALVLGAVIGQTNKFVSGLGASSGVSDSTINAVGGLLDQSSDGILDVKGACSGN